MELPHLTADLPGTGGALRASPEDFVVDEVPAYAPSGAGDHVFARIEKRGLTTPQAVERMARALGASPRDIGVAGMKDRRAVTRQWISLPPPIAPEAVLAVQLADIAVLEAARHPHKLRTGHLRANRFTLRIREVARDAAARATAILARLAQPPGAPNWYGEQRFGKDGDNAARGRAILAGEPAPRDKRLARLLVSALQSELFNTWLVARIAAGDYAHVVGGDVLHKLGGGLFDCTEPAVDQVRLAAGELVATGPMFGARMRRAGGDAGVREAAVLAAGGLTEADFGRVRALAQGTRRDASVLVGAPCVTRLDGGDIEVTFTLPSGAYATAVMREVTKC